MKNKIIDYQSLLLEKQRLKNEILSQEKDIVINFQKVRKKLNPSYLVRQTVIDLIPKDIRENTIVSFVSSLILPKPGSDNEDGQNTTSSVLNNIFSLAQSSALAWVMKYVSQLTDEGKKE